MDLTAVQRACLHSTQLLVTGLVLLGAGTSCGSDPGTANVALSLDSGTFNAGSGSISFSLLDKNNGDSGISDSQLTIVHEKNLHVYVFDEALQEFRHEHPTYNGSKWVLPISLSVNGNYRIYAQGRLTTGQLDFTADSTFVTSGGTAANSAPPVLTSTLVGTDGLSRITLGGAPLSAGRSGTLSVTFDRTDSSSPVLGVYLGEYFHAVFVPAAGYPLVHIHGMLMSGVFSITTTLPSAGIYRGWIQFKDAGVLKTVPLAVEAQ
jgi:hypothetical protein